MKNNELRMLINKQFEIAGIDKTYEDALKDEEWYKNNIISKEKAEEFKEYLYNYFRKEKRFTVKRSKEAMLWFWAMWGLKEGE